MDLNVSPASRTSSPKYWENARSGAPRALKKRTIMEGAMRDNWTVNGQRECCQTFCSDHDSPITSLAAQPLGLCSRLQFGRNRADDKGFKAKLDENGANFANAQSRFVELEVNDIVICVHLVAQA